MVKRKTPLICAGVGCVFSLFLGLINGVRFYNIIVRAGVTGIIFGGFVFIASFILDKFLPGLFNFEEQREDSLSGKNLNIMLDDDEQAAFLSDEFYGDTEDDDSLLSLGTDDNLSSVEDADSGIDEEDHTVISSNTDPGELNNTDAQLSTLTIPEEYDAAVETNAKIMAQAISTILKKDD